MPADSLEVLSTPGGLPRDLDASVRFTLRLGKALHRYGTPAHRLEEIMRVICAQLGLEARFVSTPTVIYASFGDPEALRTTIIRVDSGNMDLDRLSRLDTVGNAVVARIMTPEQGAAEVDRILAMPNAYRPWATVLASGFASGAGAQLFGGGLKEVAVSFWIGLVVGVLMMAAEKHARFARGFETVAAFAAAAFSVLGTRVLGGYSTEITTLAALVYLLPGLTLAVAMTELSTRNLVSGTARFTGALLVLLQLGFGVALGRQIDQLLPAVSKGAPITPLPTWTAVIALGLVTLSLAVLYRARLRDSAWILAAGVVAYGGGRLGASWLGPQLGTFVGAFALGAASKIFSRLCNRPSMITMVPGLMLLVPGSIGFRSLQSMLAQDVLAGLTTAFSMVMVLMGLVAGILLANITVSSRSILDSPGSF